MEWSSTLLTGEKFQQNRKKWYFQLYPAFAVEVIREGFQCVDKK